MRMKLKNAGKTVILFGALLLAVNVLNAQTKDSVGKKAALVRGVNEAINNAIAENKIPGAVIQVKKDGQVIYEQAYGDAQKFNYNHELLPVPDKMTTGTLFDLASLTKVVGTTTSIMLLVDRGLVKIDDPVSKYVPAFGTPDKAAITIRHLLTHTAGLYEWYPLYYRASNKQETFKLIGELPLRFPVGAERKYSDLGFTVLGEIVETVSGMSLDKFEAQNIFIPLGMKNTMFNPLKTGRNFKIAATSLGNPYETRMVHDPSLGFQFKEINPDQWNGWRHYVLKGEVNDGNAWYAEGGVAGAAGLFSTVEDLQKLVDMLMHKGKADGKQFITEQTIDTFLTKDKFNNGLGWMMDPTNAFMKNAPAGAFGHTGFTGTSIAVVPDYHLSIIILINRQNVGLQPTGTYYNPNPVRQGVFDAVMNWIVH